MPITLDGTNGVTNTTWTTATRPSAPSAGQQGYNSTLSAMEFYNGSAWVQGSQSFVAGMIMLWSGLSASIPSGWLLCDGTNSTPDLRNRFVVGATSTYAVGATGGSADAVLVSHTHTATVTDSGHFHSTGNPDTGGGSYFGVIGATGGNSTNRDGLVGGLVNSNTYQTNTKTTGISVSNNTQGVSGTNANLPPYYALCYIMKS